MGDFNHGHIQWKSLEIPGGEDQQFLLLIQEYLLCSARARTNQKRGCIRYISLVTKSISGKYNHHWVHFDINEKPESKNKKRTGETSVMEL